MSSPPSPAKAPAAPTAPTSSPTPHVLILSTSGKPILSLPPLPSDSTLVTLSGLTSALLSFGTSLNREITKISTTNKQQYVFLRRGGIILCCLSRGSATKFNLPHATHLLETLYAHIIFTLTGAVHKTMKTRKNYDVASLLTDVEGAVEGIVDGWVCTGDGRGGGGGSRPYLEGSRRKLLSARSEGRSREY